MYDVNVDFSEGPDDGLDLLEKTMEEMDKDEWAVKEADGRLYNGEIETTHIYMESNDKQVKLELAVSEDEEPNSISMECSSKDFSSEEEAKEYLQDMTSYAQKI